MLRKGGIGSRPTATDDQQPQSSPSLGAEGSQWATPAYMDTRSPSAEHYTASSDDLTGIDHAHSQTPQSAAQPTIIQLDDVAAGEDGVASMTGDTTGIRSRSAPATEVPQLTPPRARRDTGRSKSSSQEEDDFDPVEEFLGVLPPPLARFLVFLGTKLNPAGLQLIAVKKDLKEEPKADIYNTNKTQHIVKALTTGLKPYGLALAIAAVVWILTTFISPSFFVYPYLHLDPSGIFSSWPLFLGEGVLASAVWYFRGRDVRTQGRPFFLKAANSLLVATVEELGFRFLFVCFAMVATGLFNVFIEQVGIYLGALMMVAGVVVMIIAALYLMGVLKQNEHVRRIMKRYNPVHVVVGSGILIVAGLCVLVMGLVWNALFAILWDWLIFPVVNFLTFYQYDQLFMGAFGMNFNSYEGAWAGSRRRRKIWQQNATDNRMFMVGILLANVFYRDGKKYQGVLGWLNSWYVGLALANAMLTHGLFTALAVHLLYDAQFFVVGYIVNKYFAKRRPSLDDL